MLFKRAANIVKDEPVTPGGRDLAALRGTLTEPAELSLVDALEARRTSIAGAVAQADYGRALQDVAALRPAVDKFFTDVFVMVEDPALRQARLGLLAELRDTVRAIADLSSLAGPQA